MKKLAIAAAAAAALTAGVANAYTTGTFSNGFVVPNAYFNSSTDKTVVGILAAQGVGVNWVFYDENSKHLRDGCFDMTKDDFEAFDLSAPKSGNQTLDVSQFAGKRGYLVFAVGYADSSAATGASTNVKGSCSTYDAYLPSVTTNNQLIAGAAFHVNTAASDVAYVPVIDGPLTASSGVNFALSNTDPVEQVAGAAPANATHYMRFFTAGGAKTDIVIWNTSLFNASTQFQTTGYPFDTQQQQFGSVSFNLKNKELNIIDAKSLVGSTPTDGFFKWQARSSGTQNAVFTYSVINAPAFGAVQSIINPYTR
jgi:hypothetical protein